MLDDDAPKPGRSHPGPPWANPTPPDPLEDVRRMCRELERLPPRAREIRASHLVPYGRAYRQWLTNGDLIVWANRGEIADLPRAPARKTYGFDVALSPLVPPEFFGIPVINA